MINHIETINQILDKEKKISKEDIEKAIKKVNLEDIENMKMYFQERIDKDFIEDEDLALNFMKIALNYIKNLELENEDLKNLANKTQWISPCYVAQNYIAKSVIQNKIDELKEEDYKLKENRHKLDYGEFIENVKKINIQIATLEILILNPKCEWLEN